jgi:hypothetical protein
MKKPIADKSIGADLKTMLLNAKIVRSDVPNIERAIGTLILDGVELKYGDLTIIAEQCKLDEARQLIQALTGDERRQVRNRTGKVLSRIYSLIRSGTFDKATADSFYANLILWQALAKE